MTNRAPGRNIHIYSANDQDMVLGGLALNKGITNVQFTLNGGNLLYIRKRLHLII